MRYTECFRRLAARRSGQWVITSAGNSGQAWWAATRDSETTAAAASAPGHTFVVLEVEPFTAEEQKLEQPPFDGPEMKYRFGRAFERATGADIFGYRVS